MASQKCTFPIFPQFYRFFWPFSKSTFFGTISVIMVFLLFFQDFSLARGELNMAGVGKGGVREGELLKGELARGECAEAGVRKGERLQEKLERENS